MKKILVSAVLTAIGCISVAAQGNIFNNPANKPYFGVRLGGDITCPGDFKADKVGVSVYKNGGGFEFGGIYNLPIIANFYIEPGLKLYYDTYSMTDDWLEIMSNFDIDSASIRKFGMRIPVMAGYHFDFGSNVKVSVFTGPELEIGFVAKEHIKASVVSSSESVYGEDGGMNRIDLLWGIGAGVSYQHFYFGINGGIGMLNMLSDSDAKFHENRVTIGVGYNF